MPAHTMRQPCIVPRRCHRFWVGLPVTSGPAVWAALRGAWCIQVWQEVAGQIYFAALTFQIIMLGLFLIKGAPVQTLLTVPLPILTVLLWRSSDVLFRPPQQRLSLEAAADLDERDRVILFTLMSDAPATLFACPWQFMARNAIDKQCMRAVEAHQSVYPLILATADSMHLTP